MRVYYCKKCNHFSYATKIRNYCIKCRTPILEVPMDFNTFAKLSINERYRMAYRMTNEYDALTAELRNNKEAGHK